MKKNIIDFKVIGLNPKQPFLKIKVVFFYKKKKIKTVLLRINISQTYEIGLMISIF